MSSAKAPDIDLVAEARAIPRKPNGEPCSVVMATRNRPDLAASIVALVHDSTVSAATAATVLSRHGITIAGLAISRHRRTPCVHCTYHGLHS